MAGKGSPPGVRQGGRQKGTPNKTTLARAEAIRNDRTNSGLPLAVDAMRDGMHRYIALSAPFQKGAATQDIKQFEHFFDKAMKLADKVAPYESPTLQSTTLVGDKDKPVTATLNVHFV